MDPPSWLRGSDLAVPVRRLLGGDAVTIDRWSVEPIAGGMGEALGVWRVTGDASIDGTHAPFTLILKGWRIAEGRPDTTAWDWPYRELRAYTSGSLDRLPGDIAAPRCLGVFEPDDGSIWICLTPMSAGAIDTWTLEHFALVARCLGQFNGAWLDGRPLPEGDWLSRHWTRQWTEAAREAIEQIDRFIEHPLVARALPPAERREIERLFAERHRWFDALDALPQVFSHLDAFPRNIFLRPDPNGRLQPGLVDWSFAGIAAIGEEIAPLVSASVIFGEAGHLSLADLDATVFPAYIAGLRDAGWTGDERLARMGYTGSLVMRYAVGPLRQSLPMLANEQYHPLVEQIFGVPVNGLIDRVRVHHAWALGLADEFREHLASITPRLPDAA